jgi:hypothetical protein
LSAEGVAREHYHGRRGLAEAVARLARQIWARIDPGDLDASWSRYGPELVVGLAGAQLAVAGRADEYTEASLEAQGASAAASDAVNPSSLAGIASDGRPLDSLLLNAITTVKAGVAGGAGIDQAMGAGYANLSMLVQTQVADAGRNADQLALVARKVTPGYVRMVQAGACGRCIVLAGRFYRWNAGFLRHPACHCVHVPAAEDRPGDVRTNPRAWFDSLGKAEQDKQFTAAGAQAIRDGADIGQVVNARRGAFGLATAGGRIADAEARLLRGERGRLRTQNIFGQDLFVTTEGTTSRGAAGRRLGARGSGQHLAGNRYRTARPPRLMPESIYKIAGDDREEALRLLRRNGYLRDAPRRARPIQPRVPVQRSAAGAGRPSLADRVKAGITDRRMLSGGQNAKTELLTLADGSKVVFKKARPVEGVSARFQQDAEELVPMVLQAAGLRVPEMYRPTANQLYMEYLEGTIGTKFRAIGSHDIDLDRLDRDQALLMGLVDQITDNYDRNSGNFLVGVNGDLLGIDHGFAFSFYGEATPHMPRMALSGQFSSQFMFRADFRDQWADNDMSPADLAEMRTRLYALLPEFARLGREDWHAKMLIRLRQIERHAKGSKRRIL